MDNIKEVAPQKPQKPEEATKKIEATKPEAINWEKIAHNYKSILRDIVSLVEKDAAILRGLSKELEAGHSRIMLASRASETAKELETTLAKARDLLK